MCISVTIHIKQRRHQTRESLSSSIVYLSHFIEDKGNSTALQTNSIVRVKRKSCHHPQQAGVIHPLQRRASDGSCITGLLQGCTLPLPPPSPPLPLPPPPPLQPPKYINDHFLYYVHAPKKLSAPQGAMKYEIIRISSFGKVGIPASFIFTRCFTTI